MAAAKLAELEAEVARLGPALRARAGEVQARLDAQVLQAAGEGDETALRNALRLGAQCEARSPEAERRFAEEAGVSACLFACLFACRFVGLLF